MNCLQQLAIKSLSLGICLVLVSSATAENSDIKYATLCENTNELEQIGAELRDAFSQEFRRSGVYRKLMWNAGKLKRQSNRLHRTARRQAECRWDRQIANLNETVCKLDDLLVEAHSRIASQLDPPCCNCVVYVDDLIASAKSLILGLEVAAGINPYYLDGPPVNIVEQPLELGPAPGFLPQPPTHDYYPDSILPESQSAPFIPDETQLTPPGEQNTTPRSILNKPAVLNSPDGAMLLPNSNTNSVLVPNMNQPIEGPPLTGPVDTSSSFDTAKTLKPIDK